MSTEKKQVKSYVFEIHGIQWWVKRKKINDFISHYGDVSTLIITTKKSNSDFNNIIYCLIRTKHTPERVAQKIQKNHDFGENIDVKIIETIPPNLRLKNPVSEALNGRRAPFMFEDPRVPVPLTPQDFDDDIVPYFFSGVKGKQRRELVDDNAVLKNQPENTSNQTTKTSEPIEDTKPKPQVIPSQVTPVQPAPILPPSTDIIQPGIGPTGALPPPIMVPIAPAYDTRPMVVAAPPPSYPPHRPPYDPRLPPPVPPRMPSRPMPPAPYEPRIAAPKEKSDEKDIQEKVEIKEQDVRPMPPPPPPLRPPERLPPQHLPDRLPLRPPERMPPPPPPYPRDPRGPPPPYMGRGPVPPPPPPYPRDPRDLRGPPPPPPPPYPRDHRGPPPPPYPRDPRNWPPPGRRY